MKVPAFCIVETAAMSQQSHIQDAQDFEQPELPQDPPSVETRRRSGWAIWAGSAATHGAALALMALIYTTVAKEETVVLPPIRTTVIPASPKADLKADPVTSENQDIKLPEITDVVQPITPVDLVVVDPGDESLAESQLPKGDKSAETDVAMSFTSGVQMAIGAGNDSAGKFGDIYGKRGKRGKRGPIGAPAYAPPVVERALAWFKRHQSPDGRWDADGYYLNCTAGGVKCEPGKDQPGDTDIATTAYAILTYLGDGYDHQTPNKYRSVVKRGLEFLINSQKPDGLLGQRNYEHAIATMALAQAYGMVPDPWLRAPTQKAVDIILARQNRDSAAQAPYDRLGWDYVNATDRNDASITGWNVMALKAAMVAGLKIDEGLSGSKVWLDRSWKAANTGKPWCADTNKLDPYKGISRFGYVWKASDNSVEMVDWDAANNRPTSIDNHDLAPVGLMCSVFLGHRAGDPMLESLGNYVAQFHMPTTWPCNTYYLYYNTLGMYQLGGERWDRWAKQVLPMLRDSQRLDEDSCYAGSWDWVGTKFHGNDTGRVLSTAYAALSMQVYWLYEKTNNAKKKG